MAGTAEIMAVAKAVYEALPEAKLDRDGVIAIGKALDAGTPWKEAPPLVKVSLIRLAIALGLVGDTAPAAPAPAPVPPNPAAPVAPRPPGSPDPTAAAEARAWADFDRRTGAPARQEAPPAPPRDAPRPVIDVEEADRREAAIVTPPDPETTP